jgi:hypothetical protein
MRWRLLPQSPVAALRAAIALLAPGEDPEVAFRSHPRVLRLWLALFMALADE